MYLESAVEVWSKGGWLLLPLALVSMLIFLLIFRSAFSLRPLIRSAADLGADLESCGGDTGKIREQLSASRTPLAQVYIAGMHQENHAPDFLESFERSSVQAQSRDLVLLAALTSAAPLLGLLGTVAGMIETFTATAALSGDTGQQIADGISSALITTQFGLVVALPGVFGISYLRKRIRDLETMLCQCRFLIAGAMNQRAAPGA